MHLKSGKDKNQALLKKVWLFPNILEGWVTSQALFLLFPLLHPHTMASCSFHVWFARGELSWLVPIQHVASGSNRSYPDTDLELSTLSFSSSCYCELPFLPLSGVLPTSYNDFSEVTLNSVGWYSTMLTRKPNIYQVLLYFTSTFLEEGEEHFGLSSVNSWLLTILWREHITPTL